MAPGRGCVFFSSTRRAGARQPEPKRLSPPWAARTLFPVPVRSGRLVPERKLEAAGQVVRASAVLLRPSRRAPGEARRAAARRGGRGRAAQTEAREPGMSGRRPDGRA